MTEKRGEEGIDGEKYVWSQLLWPLGLSRKGGLEARKPQNYCSVCRRWVRSWATTYTKYATRQKQKQMGNREKLMLCLVWEKHYLDNKLLFWTEFTAWDKWEMSTTNCRDWKVWNEKGKIRCWEIEERDGRKGRRLKRQFRFQCAETWGLLISTYIKQRERKTKRGRVRWVFVLIFVWRMFSDVLLK